MSGTLNRSWTWARPRGKAKGAAWLGLGMDSVHTLWDYLSPSLFESRQNVH